MRFLDLLRRLYREERGGGGTSPIVKQVGFRARKDNVSLSSTTWDDPGVVASQNLPQNTNWTQPVDVVFRYRTLISDTTTSTKTSNYNNLGLEYNLAGGGWNSVSGTSPIQWAASGNYADGDTITTSQITGGQDSWTNGAANESDNSDGSYTLGNGTGHTEIEWALYVDSAQVTDAQTFQVRVAGMNSNDGETIPTVTVSEPAAVIPRLVMAPMRPAFRL